MNCENCEASAILISLAKTSSKQEISNVSENRK